tara:strand:+ start:455 stop:658 length:204 start_codon:yes stop_codon:yes gene_type:complete
MMLLGLTLNLGCWSTGALALNLGNMFEVVGCTCWKAIPLFLKADETWSLLLELAGVREVNLMLVLYY